MRCGMARGMKYVALRPLKIIEVQLALRLVRECRTD